MPRRPGADARQRARHAATAPARFRRLYETLAAFPTCERPLVGQQPILTHLHALALRRPNGGPVTWRMVLRWHRDHDFPLLSGHYALLHRRTPALSSTAAITAWTLTRFSTNEDNLFRVCSSNWPKVQGRRPRKSQRESGVGRGNWTRPLATIDVEALLDSESATVAAAPR